MNNLRRYTIGVATHFTYTNYKGETRIRYAIPLEFMYGTTPHHPEPQWLMKAMDMDKKEYRTFALSGIQSPAT